MQERDHPERPARGIPPEEALERWSDPEAYAAMREYWEHRLGVSVAAGKKPTQRVLLHKEYKKRRNPLVRAFHTLLEEGRLLATAVHKYADPTAARILVDPEVFSDAYIRFDMGHIRGRTRPYELELVEIFAPPGVPRNVRVIRDWYWEIYEPSRAGEPESTVVPAAASTTPVTTPAFDHYAAYRHVTIHGTDFSLTTVQATVVRQLHEAHLSGNPWQYGATLLHAAGSRSLSLFQIFRRQTSPHWSVLIESDGRGYYRLNVHD